MDKGNGVVLMSPSDNTKKINEILKDISKLKKWISIQTPTTTAEHSGT